MIGVEPQGASESVQLFLPVHAEREGAGSQLIAVDGEIATCGQRVVESLCCGKGQLTVGRLTIGGKGYGKMRNDGGCVVVAMCKTLGDAAAEAADAHRKVETDRCRIGEIGQEEGALVAKLSRFGQKVVARCDCFVY